MYCGAITPNQIPLSIGTNFNLIPGPLLLTVASSLDPIPNIEKLGIWPEDVTISQLFQSKLVLCQQPSLSVRSIIIMI